MKRVMMFLPLAMFGFALWGISVWRGGDPGYTGIMSLVVLTITYLNWKGRSSGFNLIIGIICAVIATVFMQSPSSRQFGEMTIDRTGYVLIFTLFAAVYGAMATVQWNKR